MNRRFEGAHEISVHELKGRMNGDVVDILGVSQLVAFRQRTDVTVRHKTVKCDPTAVLPVHELQVALVEVAQPPVPHLGLSHRIYRQLFSCVPIRTEV